MLQKCQIGAPDLGTPVFMRLVNNGTIIIIASPKIKYRIEGGGHRILIRVMLLFLMAGLAEIGGGGTLRLIVNATTDQGQRFRLLPLSFIV